MDKPEDITYLKQFVKQHPENRMGWYLLGKQYLLAGKEAKANYCFLQAGDVYDAFEDESHPLSEKQLLQLREWQEKRHKSKLLRKTGMLALLLMLLVVLLPANGSIHPRDFSPSVSSEELTKLPEIGVVLVRPKEQNPVGKAWQSMLGAATELPSLMLALRLEEEEEWRKWPGSRRLIMAAERGEASGQWDVSMLDQAACNCEPGEAGEYEERLGEWASRQEQHWVLASAIHHYERLNDKWPDRFGDLVQPYPHNVLSGETGEMRSVFPQVLARLQQMSLSEAGGPDKAADGKDGNSSTKGSQVKPDSGSNGLLDKEWERPFEIIVDKSTYRLAVVQGNIMVRNYEVGLGGDKTPEGSFEITEKVRNPNGRDDGPFGSRGMTLSDTLYAIHGTDEPDSIGKDESLGCVRMNQDDLEELFDLVPLGTVVHIKNGTLPVKPQLPKERFKLEPRQNETNPAKVYEWLS